jgi:transmembrane sensor
MNMTNEPTNIVSLIYRHLQETLSPEEAQRLDEWRQASADNAWLWDELTRQETLGNALAEYHPDNRMELEGKILQKIREGSQAGRENLSPAVHRAHLLRSTWFRYAAAALFLVATGSYLWFRSNREQPVAGTYKQLPTDIESGKTGAVLTLADGTLVVLDNLKNGVIAAQNGAQAVLNNGQLTYDVTGNSDGKMAYNTMSTPKGRQFHVTLPDGTKVWLNAASSIRYPTAFVGKERTVEVTGEAYFEVTKDKTKPFFVMAVDQAQIEVLGTSFNINAYTDEAAIKATLLEGSVRVTRQGDNAVGRGSKAGGSVLLKPGQQAQITETNGQRPTVVNLADIDKVVAWKSGVFNFDGVDFAEAMRQLSRWYDLEVVYEGGVPNIHFFGEINRDLSLAGLVKWLEGAKVHFRIEKGNRLVVLP